MPAFLDHPPPHCGIREEEKRENVCPAIIRRRSTDQASSHPGWESLRDTKECTITASKGVGVNSAKWEKKEGDLDAVLKDLL